MVGVGPVAAAAGCTDSDVDDGNTSTTTYNAAGQVASVDDGKGTYAYTYDGTDSRGKKERRGMVTSVDVGLASGPDVVTGAYDANGQLIEQELPGGLGASWDPDITGTARSVAYSQNDVELLAFSQTYDHAGRVRSVNGPESSQTYTYDTRDRLATVADTHLGLCTTRRYGFDRSSNRTSLKAFAAGTGGACQDATASSEVTTSFDTGDRITTSGYAYDRLGRTTTVPAAHTDHSDGSNLTVKYFSNNMVNELSQTTPGDDEGPDVTVKQEFTLDALDRIAVTKGFTGGVNTSETTNKYACGGDSPTWTQTRTRPNASTGWATTWNRNVATLAGGLGISQPSSGDARLQLTDLRGNIVASSTIGGTGLDSYTEYTEYGLARDTVPEDYNGYGWLGAHTRKTAGNVSGVSLMGVRLYNPETGRFLSRDSVPGGNDNAYVYPPDPINKRDLDGRIQTASEGPRMATYITKVNGKSVTYAGVQRTKTFTAPVRPSPRAVDGRRSISKPKSKGFTVGFNAAASACLLGCVEASVGLAIGRKPQFSVRGGLGGAVGIGVSVGPSFGRHDLVREKIGCSGKYGPVGAYATVLMGPKSLDSIEFGWAGGIGGGCQIIVNSIGGQD